MTTNRNPEAMKTAAVAVLSTLGQRTDDAYVNEAHLEMELIEQGFMDPQDVIGLIELGSDDVTGDQTVIVLLHQVTNVIINTRTGDVTINKE